MPALDPEAAARAACASRGHVAVIELSEPDVGFVGRTYCGSCHAELGQDPDLWRRYRRPDL